MITILYILMAILSAVVLIGIILVIYYTLKIHNLDNKKEELDEEIRNWIEKYDIEYTNTGNRENIDATN